MTVVAGGDATAIGEDTLATGTVHTNVVDNGPVTIATGTASFTAAAESPDGDQPYATTSSFADVSGADFVFSFTKTSSSSCTAEDGTNYVTDTSTTQFVAIDIEGIDLPGGQVTIAPSFSAPSNPYQSMLNGNIAYLDVDAQAHDESTLVEVDAYALTVEDQLSTVSVIAVTDVG